MHNLIPWNNFLKKKLARSFGPQNNINAREKFRYKIQLINHAMNPNTVLLGDLNLDCSKVHDDNYVHNKLFSDFDVELSKFYLIQMINFVTWWALNLKNQL